MGIFKALFGLGPDVNRLQASLGSWVVAQGGDRSSLRFRIYDNPRLQKDGCHACACGTFQTIDGNAVGYYVEWRNYSVAYSEILPYNIMSWNRTWENNAKVYGVSFYRALHAHLDACSNI